MAKKLILLLAVLFSLGAQNALAANKFIVNGTDGTTNKFVVTDAGYVGIEHGSPSSALHVIGPNARDAQFMLQHTNSLGNGNSGGGILLYYNNNGALPNNGDRLGYFYFGSYDGANQRNAAGIRAFADGTWVSGNAPTGAQPSGFLFETTPAGSLTRVERLRINNAGYVGINMNGVNPTSYLQVVGLPAYANNQAAKDGGLTAGAFYRTGGDPDVVCVVH